MNKQTLLKELNSEKIVLDNKKAEEKSNETKQEVKNIDSIFFIIPFIVIILTIILITNVVSVPKEEKNKKMGEMLLNISKKQEEERIRNERMQLEIKMQLMKKKIILQAKKEKEEAEKLELLEQFKNDAFKGSNISVQSIDNETVIFFNGEKVTANGEILLDKLKKQIEKNKNVKNQ